MWIARLFGGRKVQDQADEPARYPMTQAATAKRASPAQAPASAGHTAPRKGFDPYNSGAFKRHNAWERVNRR
jgi:hypothetical protein